MAPRAACGCSGDAPEGARNVYARAGRGHPADSGAPVPPLRNEMDREASWFVVEGETLVTFRICRRHGHELEIEERFRVSEKDGTLQYSQQVKGPKGKTDTYAIEFDCR